MHSSGYSFRRQRATVEALERRIVLSAYSFASLASFAPYVNGAFPGNDVAQDSAGNLFGTAQDGVHGDGMVYEVAAGSGAVTTVASLDGANGSAPVAMVMDAAGDIFGAAYHGGSNGDGTLFEIAHGSSAITTLVTFNGSNGSFPSGLVLDSSGNLLGVTVGSPATGGGTIFEVPEGSQTLTTLASFASPEYPAFGVALDSSGNLYCNGTAVFKLPRGSHAVTTLATFNFNGANGSNPQAVVVDSAGNVFGTALQGGADNWGTVFEIAQGSGTITTLVSFDDTTGANPDGLALDSSGNLFGASSFGGAGAGMIFEIPHGSTALSTLASFNSFDGTEPIGVVVDSSGNVFGDTERAGVNDEGTLFEIAEGTGAITSLASFISGPTGNLPRGNLALDSGGNLYGATSGGGVEDFGTVFEVSAATGDLSTVASFTGLTVRPQDGVSRDPSGDIFGIAGTVFEIAQGSSAITSLGPFTDANGYMEPTSFVLDSAGNLFGVTTYGGVNNDGTVFEIAQGSDDVITLASFNGTNGTYRPQGALAIDSSGDLFGTTYEGGAGGVGSVFELAQGSGTITTLASFNGKNGSYPQTALILDSSGDLFGTASSSVFEIARGSGVITTLATFNGTNGTGPQGLVMDLSGNLFGTTYQGGANNDGTIFEIAQGSMVLTTLVSFDGANGTSPQGGLVIDPLGDIYGTTSSGGMGNAGTVFELINTAPTVVAMSPASGTTAGGTVVTITGANFTGESAVDFGANPASSVSVNASGTQITATAPPGAGVVDVRVVTANGTSPVSPADKFSYLPPALVGSPVINGDDPNGLYTAAGQPAGGVQRSMVQDVVYTFDEPVTIADANAAFTVAGVGAHPGTAPPTLSAYAVPGSNGTQWAVTLTGGAADTLGSIANGEYSITINPTAVFAAADGVTQLAAGRTDQFYRLFGDINGDEVVNAADNLQFKKALATYNPAFDFNADGFVNASDNLQFKKDLTAAFLGDGFVPTI